MSDNIVRRSPSMMLLIAILASLLLVAGCTLGGTGEAGSQGAQGETGLQGETGPEGPPGSQGDTGADGEKGETGDAGPEGEQGEEGPPGISGYERITKTSLMNSVGSKIETADCAPGKNVLGGGATYTVSFEIVEVEILTSFPPNPTSWTATASEIVESGDSWQLHVFVICANVE